MISKQPAMKLPILVLILLLIPPLSAAQSQTWTRHEPIFYSKSNSIIQDAKGRLISISGNVYRSSNDGEKWEKTEELISSCVAGNGDTIFGVKGSKLYVSVDGWQSSSLMMQLPSQYFRLHPSGYFYSYQPNKLLRSSDRGVTWQELKADHEGLPGVDAFEIAQNGDLLAMRRSSLYVSTDLGDTWIRRRPSMTGIPGLRQVIVLGTNTYVVKTQDSIGLTSDGGATWKELSEVLGFPSAEWTNLIADSSGRLLGSYKGDLYSLKDDALTLLTRSAVAIGTTRDGRIWVRRSPGRLGYITGTGEFIERNQGFISNGFAEMVRLPNGEYMINAEKDVRLFTKDFKAWEIQTLPDSLYGLSYTKASPTGALYTTKKVNDTLVKLLWSSDYGRSWHQLREDRYAALAGVDSNGWIYYGQQRSKDGGLTWEDFGLAANVPGPYGFGPNGMIVNNIGTSVSISTNGGISWDTVSYSSKPTYIYTLSVLPDGSIVIPDSDSLYVSTDQGGSWRSTCPPGTRRGFTVSADEKGRVFVARADTSIFQLDLETLQYRKIIDQPTGTSATAMNVYNGTFLIYTGQGYFTTVVEEFADVISERDESFSIFPNPVSNEIQFYPRLGGACRVRILDVLGRCVDERDMELVHMQLTKLGMPDHLPNGLYFLELVRNDARAGQKFILSR
jgi:photosystem II stability/assembly factor-like uncharacterized protein